MKSIARDLRVNEKIRAREVRVIGEAGEQLGVMTVPQALQMARERNADLVEVAPTSVPPVCRILDYGKFKYEQTKKEREARKNQKIVLLKEVRMRPNIDEHDVAFKTRAVRKFLEEGDKVKITVLFRGRYLAHPQLGRDLLDQVAAELKNMSIVEKPTSMEGRNMTLILAPVAAKQPKEQPKEQLKEQPKEPPTEQPREVAREG